MTEQVVTVGCHDARDGADRCDTVATEGAHDSRHHAVPVVITLAMPSFPKVRLDALPASYARILTALARRPGLSREEIAQQAYVAATTLSGGGYLRHMKELGLIHISGWRRNATGAFTIPHYSVGPGKDYARPQSTHETRDAPGMLRLLEAIERHGPLDYRQAAHLAGLSVNTVKNAGYLKALVAQRKIHIAAWRRSKKGPPRPIYDGGAKRSAAPPPRLTSAEKSQAHRQRRLAQSGSLADQLRRLPTKAA